MSDETMFAITAGERRVIQETLAHYGRLVGWADKVVTMHGTGDERHQDLIAALAKHREMVAGAGRINLREIPEPVAPEKVELPEGMLPVEIYEKESQ